MDGTYEQVQFDTYPNKSPDQADLNVWFDIGLKGTVGPCLRYALY